MFKAKRISSLLPSSDLIHFSTAIKPFWEFGKTWCCFLLYKNTSSVIFDTSMPTLSINCFGSDFFHKFGLTLIKNLLRDCLYQAFKRLEIGLDSYTGRQKSWDKKTTLKTGSILKIHTSRSKIKNNKNYGSI